MTSRISPAARTTATFTSTTRSPSSPPNPRGRGSRRCGGLRRYSRSASTTSSATSIDASPKFSGAGGSPPRFASGAVSPTIGPTGPGCYTSISPAPTDAGRSSSVIKVGLLCGREWSFPPAVIEAINGRDEGVRAEFVKLGGTRMNEPVDYAVIIDRISHEVPYYRTYLKHAMLQGVAVVNNPFMWTADDKFFESTLADKLGVAHPRTIVLPNKDYVPGIVHSESLRNLKHPLDWQGIADYVGMPCILKDAHGGGWKEVHICNTLPDLISAYDRSGLLTMVAQ